ncbi:sugar-binding domain-containing protein [Novosphingobium sp. fls2-241-R2A-195]|jgi:hypothetical protein|uniref:sugar-binding domain-containing protein n=1 Tax=Novosphingobium sp. fls2-241-R2A-195 TaxID=3040296 RepID=UPI00254E459E|nr:sugar-binding domain-containing protein [Novosphingobium sp. fls2-241-R2A-195]
MLENSEALGLIKRRGLLKSLAVVPFMGVTDIALARSGHAAESGGKDIALAGTWRRLLDEKDVGISGRWFNRPLPDQSFLPGSLEEQRVGNAVTVATPWTGDINDKSFYTAPEYAAYRRDGNVKVPFFLQPDTWYRGPAWYQRDIDIPQDWAGKRVELFIERPHWETRVWVDGRSFGRSDALHVPHVYDLGSLPPGRHQLTIRVDNRMIVEIGHNGHGVTDHTQGNWNGIAGRIDLRATENAWIEGVDLYPQRQDRTLRVAGRLANSGRPAPALTAIVSFAGIRQQVDVSWSGGAGRFEAVIEVPTANEEALRPWDEFDPVVHEAEVELSNGETWKGRFGWRDLTGTAKGFRINERPMMFRGALECSIFPLSGHPPTDIESWRTIMRRAKDYGLNHLRFHSYCPPEAAFDAADEAGIYVQIETVWANQSVVIGSGKPVDKWVYQESDRILAAHGNHPSFILMTHGNEPGGGETKQGDARRDAFLGAYVRHYKAKDPRRLWTSGSGWPEIADNHYHVTPTPRIQNWGEELASRINSKAPETVTDYRGFVGKYQVPVISHEIGQWCVYPNLTEVRKYTGYLKARNFEIFSDRLRDSGMLGLAPEFLYASGRLQVLCYKEDIESALRTHGMGGFQLLGLQDFPGQGTALVGVLDPFWDDKGYVTGAEYRRFCNSIVPLARLEKRVIRSGEALPFVIDVAHFGAKALKHVAVEWYVAAQSGKILAQGSFALDELPLGNAPLNLSAAPAITVQDACAAKLLVRITAGHAAIAENDWDVWIYPQQAQAAPPGSVRIASTIDQGVLDHLEAGGDVLVGVPGAKVANYDKLPVKLGFSSVFWNTLWTERQAPTTLGVLCDPEHPALARFPTDAHSNWQWWYPMHSAGAFRLDLLPAGVEPIVRVIDDWFTARPLGLVVELRVGKGRIILCGFPLDTSDPADPVTPQLRDSLLAYMSSDAFRPAMDVSPVQLKSLVKS